VRRRSAVLADHERRHARHVAAALDVAVDDEPWLGERDAVRIGDLPPIERMRYQA
jgi:hypothetical protein